MISISESKYNLSQSIIHHKKTLRAVSCNKKGTIVTGSYEKKCSFFHFQENGEYIFDKDSFLHEDYIYVVKADVLDRGFFTGSKDKKMIYMDNEGSPLGEFVGHNGVVNSISQCPEEPDWIVTGSWDTTAKIWDIEKQECLYTLEGHAYAVSTLALPGKTIITGSQDKTLNIWNKEKKIITIEKAHEDIIRDIILSPSKNSFFTCSNDCLIKEWTLKGQLLNTITGHEGFCFSICFNYSTNQLFSCGDDRIVKIWKHNGAFQQNLLHHNTVWDCAINPINGDLLTACSDCILRIFSNQEARWLPKEAIDEYNKLCSLVEKEEETGDEIDISKLPSIQDISTILNPKDGEIRMFNNSGKGEAYCYKKSEKKWELLGEVMGKKKDSKTKKYYPGDNVFPAGEYDYVFDVDFQDKMTQIPFNEGGNALVAAEKFVGREKMHKNYIDDITKFLRANIGTKTQKPTITKENNPNKSQGSSSIQKNKAEQKPTATKSFSFPIMRYSIFDSVNSEGPLKKITEINASLIDKPEHISDIQLKQIGKVLDVLGRQAFYHKSTFQDYELKEYFNILSTWKNDHLIPLFDIYRMFLLHPQSNAMFKYPGGGITELTICMEVIKQKANITLTILGFRIIANHFVNESSRLLMGSKSQEILNAVGEYIDNDNKHIHSAIISILFNYSTIFSTDNINDGSLQLLALIIELLPKETDSNMILTLLKTIANLFAINEANRGFGNDMEICPIINEVKVTDDNAALVEELKAYIILLFN